MNYIKHLTGFFEKVALERTLNPTHVSLYIALFQFWNCNRFKNPISITRDEVMRISKISSKATYHKCLRNLHSLGYINYEPSYNPFKGSQVILFNFSEDLKPIPKNEKKTSSNNKPLIEQVNEQVVNKRCTSSGTGTEQALVPSINYINNTNILNDVNLETPAQNVIARNEAISKESILKNETVDEKEKSSAKKEKEIFVTSSVSSRAQSWDEKPTNETVKSYFKENNFPELEAQKFFNYFSSIGWLVGGKFPMIDWQAAANNWMLNANKFNSDEQQYNRAKHLNTTTDKDYSEPL